LFFFFCICTDTREDSGCDEMDDSPPCPEENNPDTTEIMGKSSKATSRGTVGVITPKLAVTLDAGQISNRVATKILAATVEACGGNVADSKINKSTVHRSRQRFRAERAEHLRDEFRNTFDYSTPVVVHWDGKKIQERSAGPLQERLPVLITSPGMEEVFLGSPKLKDGTGEEAGQAVANLLTEWNLGSCTQAMCADTPPANTGKLNYYFNTPLL